MLTDKEMKEALTWLYFCNPGLYPKASPSQKARILRAKADSSESLGHELLPQALRARANLLENPPPKGKL